MNNSILSRTWRGLTLPLSLLALAACSPEQGAEDAVVSAGPTSAANAGKHSGVLQTAKGAYRFTPASCLFHKEDGIDDIEIEGPGQAPDGEKFYFELSSTGNAMTIKLGVDRPFQTPERQLVAGRHVTEAFTLNVSPQSLSVPKLVLKDGNGEQVDDSASLQIDCNM